MTAVLPCVLCAKYFNDGAKAGKVFEGVTAEDFDAMVWDSTASHVVEVVLQVRGERCVGKFGEKCHQVWLRGVLVSRGHGVGQHCKPCHGGGACSR